MDVMAIVGLIVFYSVAIWYFLHLDEGQEVEDGGEGKKV